MDTWFPAPHWKISKNPSIEKWIMFPLIHWYRPMSFILSWNGPSSMFWIISLTLKLFFCYTFFHAGEICVFFYIFFLRFIKFRECYQWRQFKDWLQTYLFQIMKPIQRGYTNNSQNAKVTYSKKDISRFIWGLLNGKKVH